MTESEPNKAELYGKYEEGRGWREKVAREGVCKALDLAPVDDMNVSVKKGLGWQELAVLAGAAMVGWAAWWFGAEPTPPAAPAPAADQVEDTDTARGISIGTFRPDAPE